MSDAGNVVAACWRQWRAERALARRGVHFRSTNPANVAAAYAAMSPAEFDAVNARQAWANRQTIPRAIRGRLPDRPWRVLDLGCGTGGSTRVLAYHAPAGSEVIGYELVAPLIAVARRQRYIGRDGQDARVRFVGQGLTEPLRDGDGRRLADWSVDLACSCGVVGHHLTAATARPLARELARVVTRGGLAVLDDGPTFQTPALVALMSEFGFRPLGRYLCWPLARSGQVCFRRGS
jgi:SAM-dependent methyltransferase